MRFLENRLFGSTAEVEIRLKSESLCFNLMQDLGDDALSVFAQAIWSGGGIGDDDSEEQRLFSLPVRSEAMPGRDRATRNGGWLPGL
jgi:hypothetical protein